MKFNLNLMAKFLIYVRVQQRQIIEMASDEIFKILGKLLKLLN